MDVSPQLLREVEFREQWRGYNPDEVDDFLERVAAALERLQEKLRETSDRAVQAESRLAEESGDEALKRTLVLAQRTAQAAVEEAQAEAENLLAEASERAATTVAEAEQRAADLDAELAARSAASVESLARERSDLEADVTALQAWVDVQQRDLVERFRQHLDLLEGPGRLSLSEPPVLSERPEPPAEEAVAEDEGGEGVAEDDVVDVDADPGDPTQAEADVTDDESSDATGDEDEAVEAQDDAADHGAPRPNGHDDDPFLDELRQAMDDTEPLGPRDENPRPPVDGDGDDELTPAGRFRRRRRS